MKQYEKVWLNKVDQIIEQRMSNAAFSTKEIPAMLGISKATLYRNLVKLTGHSPSKYLLNKRLIKAKEILDRGKYTTIEMTALAVGFKNGIYFSRQFAQKYKKAPKSRLTTEKIFKRSVGELLATTTSVQSTIDYQLDK